MKKLVNGHLMDISKNDLDFFTNCPEQPQNLNEPVDRKRINEETKKMLKEMYLEYPKTKVLLLILLGKEETIKLIGELNA